MDIRKMRVELTGTLSQRRRGEVMAPCANRVRLRVRPASGGRGRNVEVGGDVVTAGRAPENDLVLDDPEVSILHAEFRLAPGGANVRDLGSTNGVWHGDVRLDAGFVPEGAEVRMGSLLVGIQNVSETEEPLSSRRAFGQFVAVGTEMSRLFAKLERFSKSPWPILVQGDTGVGKELIAQAIHEHSKRESGPYHALNCGALPPSLIEAELFGHDAGAFTGAKVAKRGIFERSSGGTVFLDEIGELPLSQQAALLRVLDPGMVKRLGEDGSERPVDVRVIAATNRDLRKMVNEGAFRADLYFRLAVGVVQIPPLRERSKGNIAALLKLFSQGVGEELGVDIVFSRDAQKALEQYPWPGNARELQSLVRACALETPVEGTRVLVTRRVVGEVLRDGFVVNAVGGADTTESFEQYTKGCQRRYVMTVVEECEGNKVAAAKRLGISRSQLYRLLR